MRETYPRATGSLSPSKVGSSLPPVALSALRALETVELYPRNSEFYSEGESPEGIYILHTGCAEISIADNQGRKLVLGLARPGDILGLSAVLSGKHYEETAAAAIPSQTGFIKCDDFLRFLSDHPEAAFWVVQLLSDRVTARFEQLSCFKRAPLQDIQQ